jgi:hypothetical protein
MLLLVKNFRRISKMKHSYKPRTTDEVFESHLQLRLKGDVEQDILQNYSPDVVLLTNHGNFHGHQGVRKSSQIFNKHLPDAKIKYLLQVVERDAAFLVWNAETVDVYVKHGTDSFFIKNGLIKIQTIYYVVEDKKS